jgi:hypothetical protein
MTGSSPTNHEIDNFSPFEKGEYEFSSLPFPPRSLPSKEDEDFKMYLINAFD